MSGQIGQGHSGIRRASAAPQNRNPFPLHWIGIYGKEPRPTEPIIRVTFHGNGVDGTTTAVVPWET